MNSLEDEVAVVFRHQAASVQVPMPPTQQLVDAGESERRRGRRHTVLMVAAVVLSVVAGTSWVVLGQRGDDQPPVPSRSPSNRATPTPKANPNAALDDLPQGRPPALPYLSDHALHVGGLAVPTTGNRLYGSGDTVLVQKWSGTDPTWWRLDGQRLVPEPALHGVFEPRLSPSGDLVVWWTNPDRSTTRVVAWDPRTRQEVDRLDLALPQTCCDGGPLLLIGIDRHDNVFWADTDGYQVWRPGHGAPLPFTGGHDLAQVIAPDGPVVTAEDGSGLLGQIDVTGRWSRIAALPVDQGMVWSADGTLMAYSGEAMSIDIPRRFDPASWVRDVRTQKSELLAVPEGVDSDVIGFEGSESVLVEAYGSGHRSYVLRCAVVTGACERALTPGTTRTSLTFAQNF